MIAKIVINSLVAFASLFLIAKILGKKQIAELTFCDYAVGISLGSISAEWAIDDGDKPWQVYCIAIAIFFALSIFIDFAERKSPFLKKLFKGSPIVLISNGEIDYINLKKSKLDVNALLGMCRVAGYFDIRDVAYAVFETGGELSILPRPSSRPVFDDALSRAGKDREWLFSQLNGQDVKRVLLACYDKNTDSIFVKTKNTEKFADIVK